METLFEILLRSAGNNSDFHSGFIRRKKSDDDLYVTLYPQRQNAMIFYAPNSQFRAAPLHVNFTARTFDQDLWNDIEPFTIGTGGDPAGKTTRFSHRRITSDQAVIAVLRSRRIIP